MMAFYSHFTGQFSSTVCVDVYSADGTELVARSDFFDGIDDAREWLTANYPGVRGTIR